MDAKHTTLVMTLMLVVGFALPAAGAVVADVVDVIEEQMTERYIVAFTADPGLRAGDTYQGERVVDFIDGLNFVVIETNSFAVFEARAHFDERVRYVEWDNPEYAHLLYTPNDPLHTHSALWGTTRVGAEAAWDVTLGSSAVKVAVVDSGLNKNHEEFAGQSRVLNGYNFHGGNTDTSDQNGCNFHGTHVSGTLGATTDNGKGIAGLSQSSILPVKIFGSGFFGCGGASTTNIANALKYAGDQGAHISQNSWGGGGSSSAINDAIAYSHNKGTTHVAAAGNSGPCTNCVNTPWAENADKVIIVSSSDSDDGFSSFSSQGPQVTVIAPGGGVGSSTSGTSDYHIMSGTSMAAPHVTGSLALYIAANGNVGFNSLRTALTSTAEDLGHSSDRQGAGLVRVDSMLGAEPTDPTDPTDPDPETSEMHVHAIAHSTSGGRPTTRDLYADVTIFDANENGVGGVTVCVEITKQGNGAKATGCGDTNGSGDIRFTWGGAGRDTYTTCVTSLTKSDWTWAQAADHASNGSCHTSTV